MSAAVLHKSLDLLSSIDGIASSSNQKQSKRAKKKRKVQEQMDKEAGITAQRSVFLPEKRAKVKSAVEECQSQPKVDHLKRNVRYMKFLEGKQLNEKVMRKLISIHQLPYKRQKRALDKARHGAAEEMALKRKLRKKKNEPVFSDKDFENWAKGLSGHRKKEEAVLL